MKQAGTIGCFVSYWVGKKYSSQQIPRIPGSLVISIILIFQIRETETLNG